MFFCCECLARHALVSFWLLSCWRASTRSSLIERPAFFLSEYSPAVVLWLRLRGPFNIPSMRRRCPQGSHDVLEADPPLLQRRLWPICWTILRMVPPLLRVGLGEFHEVLLQGTDNLLRVGCRQRLPPSYLKKLDVASGRSRRCVIIANSRVSSSSWNCCQRLISFAWWSPTSFDPSAPRSALGRPRWRRMRRPEISQGCVDLLHSRASEKIG